MNQLVFRSLSLAAVFGLVFAAAPAQAGDTQVSASEDASRPFVVKIHADWCGTCRRLEGPLESLQDREGGNARYVVLDVTDPEAVAASLAEAERLGIRAFFERYQGGTGTVGVLHGATREPVSVLIGETDVAVYSEALRKARAKSSS